LDAYFLERVPKGDDPRPDLIPQYTRVSLPLWQTLRNSMLRLRGRGKRTHHFAGPTATRFSSPGAADEVVLQPAGEVKETEVGLRSGEATFVFKDAS